MIMDDGDQGDPECSYLEDGVDTAQEAGDHRRQMMQFCGQMPFCTAFNSRRAMGEAKKNVELGFPVVGVVELWEETLEVLEHMLPAFFRGALQMYRSRGRIRINSNNIKVFFGLI